MKYTKDDLELVLEHGLDIKTRTIYWGKDKEMEEEDYSTVFHQMNAERFVRSLQMLAAINKQPITLKMNSGGGSLVSMFYMIDEILRCPCQVKFEGGGMICSAATFIMAVCDERWLHKNTEVMVHELASSTDGKRSNMEVDARTWKHMKAQMVEIYAANSYMGKQFWTEIFDSGRDVYITPEEAIAYGLADDIIEPVKRGNLRKKRAKHLAKTPNLAKIQKMSKTVFDRANIKQAIQDIAVHNPAADAADPNIIIEKVQPEVTDNEPVL